MAKKTFKLTEDHINVVSGLDLVLTKEAIEEREKENINIFGGGYDLLEEIALIIYGQNLEMNTDIFATKSFNLTQEQKDYSEKISNELPLALKIILQNKSFETGEYVSKSYDNKWIKKK